MSHIIQLYLLIFSRFWQQLLMETQLIKSLFKLHDPSAQLVHEPVNPYTEDE